MTPIIPFTIHSIRALPDTPGIPKPRPAYSHETARMQELNARGQ